MSVVAQVPVRPRRRWIWVLVALATAIVLVVPVALRMGLKADLRHETVPPSAYSSRQVTAIEVTAPGASVTVRRDTTGQVTVASSLQWLLTRPGVRLVRQGRTLAVSVGCPQLNPFEDCGVGLTIDVPAGTRVQADVGSGSLWVSGLSGPLSVRATTGSNTLNDDSGPVLATATTGSISAPGLTSPRVTAAVGAGSLSLRFAAAPESLAVTVRSGSGWVTLPPGIAYQVDRAGPGLVRVALAGASAGSGRRIWTYVGRGTLTISDPPPTPRGRAGQG